MPKQETLNQGDGDLFLTSVRLRRDQAKKLDRLSRKRNVQRAELIRASIDLYLAMNVGRLEDDIDGEAA